jgi:hypothetical protein
VGIEEQLRRPMDLETELEFLRIIAEEYGALEAFGVADDMAERSGSEGDDA